jgi:putative Mg2+ transporter-C (MgtC) family protein
MAFLHSFTLPDFLDSLVSLFAAFVLGTAIGAERQYRQRGGGLRTHVLVSVGAATFVDIGMHLNGNPGATQIIAYVVSGVGFLGAGVIMKQGSSVLRPLVNAINRAPIEEGATEAIYEVRVTTKTENLDEVRELLRDQLEAAHYPPKDIEAVERERGDVELVAVLVGSSADPNELDGVVSRLDAQALVETASWDFRTTE